MNVLAIDLGSTTGIALGGFLTGSPWRVESKTWATDKELRDMRKVRLDRRGDIRVIRFFSWLQKAREEYNIDAVVFEDVQFIRSTAQGQLWPSFRAALWLAFPATLIEAVSVKSLKKFATGSGSADKEAMALALKRKCPEIAARCGDDNQVDSVWLWFWAKHNLSRATV